MSVVVAVETWAGRRNYPVEIVGETKTRYRVKALASMMLPGKRFVPLDAVVLVPKYAVRKAPLNQSAGCGETAYGYDPK